MHPTAAAARYAVYTSPIRGAFALALMLGLIGCVSVGNVPRNDVSPRQLFSVAYKNLSERYIYPLDLGELSLAGLVRLSDLDPELNVAASNGKVALATATGTAGEWRSPDGNDASGWASMVSQALTTARKVSVKIRAQPESKLSDLVFEGAMSKLDRYSRYADPERARMNRAARDGFGGLGISIKVTDGVTRIIKVHPGTPAAASGLRARDRIIRVDGQPILGLGQRAVIAALRGHRGSTVKLDIERDGAAALMTIAVTRALIVIPTVTVKRAGGVMTLKISSFNQGTTSAISREIGLAERQTDRKLRGIVLDLRDNPGGLLDQAVSVADLFLVDGLILSTQGRHPRSRQIFDASWGELAAGVPMVLLVNGKSASAAEIVAVALRDRGRAVVIGSSSYGKGTVQTIIGLPNGGELTMTWARMHAPSGFAIQDHGIIPAICTSVSPDTVNRLLKGLRTGRKAGAGQLSGQLNARLRFADNTRFARKACPPESAKPAADMEIARKLLLDRYLYQRTLVDGRPAIATRQSAPLTH
jgi:carboxyl-terminal processing protease